MLGGNPVQIGYYAGEAFVSGLDWMIHGDAWLWREALALASGVWEVR